MKINVTMSGLNKMQRRLARMADPARIERVVALNGAELAQNAKKKAPVSTEKTNPGGDHGHLQNSILCKAQGDEAIVRATAEYAQYVELGTRFMDAQPYMRPALEEQKPKFLRDLKKEIAKVK